MGSNVRVLLRRQPAVPIRTPRSGRGVDPMAMGLDGSRRPIEQINLSAVSRKRRLTRGEGGERRCGL